MMIQTQRLPIKLGRGTCRMNGMRCVCARLLRDFYGPRYEVDGGELYGGKRKWIRGFYRPRHQVDGCMDEEKTTEEE